MNRNSIRIPRLAIAFVLSYVTMMVLDAQRLNRINAIKWPEWVRQVSIDIQQSDDLVPIGVVVELVDQPVPNARTWQEIMHASLERCHEPSVVSMRIEAMNMDQAITRLEQLFGCCGVEF